MAELSLVLGSLLEGGAGGASSLSSRPLCLAQSPDCTAELEFSVDRAPLLIIDDVLSPGVGEIATHCGTLDVGQS